MTSTNSTVGNESVRKTNVQFYVIVLLLDTAHRWQLFQEFALGTRLQHFDKAHSKEVTFPLHTRIFTGEGMPSFFCAARAFWFQTNHHPIDFTMFT